MLRKFILHALPFAFLAVFGCGLATPGEENEGAGGASTGGASMGGGTTDELSTGGYASGGGDGGSDQGSGTGGITTDEGVKPPTIPACPGVEPPSSSSPICRDQTDCSRDDRCMATSPPWCGVCGHPPRLCHQDEECGAGMHCLWSEYVGPCPCEELESKCVVNCDEDSCGEDEICRDSGQCEPKSCSGDGYECPAGFECAQDRPADAHGCAPHLCEKDSDCPVNHMCSPESGSADGCVRLPCTKDADCECGACVMDVCEDKIFSCYLTPY